MSDGDRRYLSIGEVLALLQDEFPDVTISKIRFLESQGLIDPERTPSGYRKFYDGDIDRLRFILREQREHYLPLKVIKDRLAAGADDGGSEGEPDDGEEDRVVVPVDRAGDGPHLDAQATPPFVAQPPGPAAGVSDAGTPGGAGVAAVLAGVSLTLDELATAAGLRVEDIATLESFGLLSGRTVGRESYYDEEALEVARLAAGFSRYGVQARHLRMYRTSAEREAGVFEQVVLPLLKQRNPRSRARAADTVRELSTLGEHLRAVLLRRAVRSSTDLR